MDRFETGSVMRGGIVESAEIVEIVIEAMNGSKSLRMKITSEPNLKLLHDLNIF